MTSIKCQPELLRFASRNRLSLMKFHLIIFPPFLIQNCSHFKTLPYPLPFSYRSFWELSTLRQLLVHHLITLSSFFISLALQSIHHLLLFILFIIFIIFVFIHYSYLSVICGNFMLFVILVKYFHSLILVECVVYFVMFVLMGSVKQFISFYFHLSAMIMVMIANYKIIRFLIIANWFIFIVFFI